VRPRLARNGIEESSRPSLRLPWACQVRIAMVCSGAADVNGGLHRPVAGSRFGASQRNRERGRPAARDRLAAVQGRRPAGFGQALPVGRQPAQRQPAAALHLRQRHLRVLRSGWQLVRAGRVPRRVRSGGLDFSPPNAPAGRFAGQQLLVRHGPWDTDVSFHAPQVTEKDTGRQVRVRATYEVIDWLFGDGQSALRQAMTKVAQAVAMTPNTKALTKGS
jgi:hypothetical protein